MLSCAANLRLCFLPVQKASFRERGHCFDLIETFTVPLYFLTFNSSLFSNLCKKHTKLVEEIRHAAVSGGQKPDTADTDDQDTEQDYVCLKNL